LQPPFFEKLYFFVNQLRYELVNPRANPICDDKPLFSLKIQRSCCGLAKDTDKESD